MTSTRILQAASRRPFRATQRFGRVSVDSSVGSWRFRSNEQDQLAVHNVMSPLGRELALGLVLIFDRYVPRSGRSQRVA